MLHALQARAVEGISPASVMNARLDWLVNLANSPSKLSTLAEKAVTASTPHSDNVTAASLCWRQ